MSYPTFVPFIQARPWLHRMMIPFARWYQNAAGYRQVGLLSDDLIPEESELVQTALSRLDERERYDRIYRLRRAIQCSIQHSELPKSEWTTEETDKPYLRDVIRQVKAEMEEREALDTIKIERKK